jgi:hypothetical protein
MKPKVKAAPRTLSDFRAAHDPNVIVPNKIRAALAAMEREGPEQWVYEAEFVRAASLGQAQLATFRDQFAAHIVETPGISGRSAKRIWFATAKAARAARGE